MSDFSLTLSFSNSPFLSSVSNVQDWSYDMTASVESVVSINNYNNQLELWEPMLEPWATEMSYSIEDGVSSVLIRNKPININISKSFVEAVLLTLSSITEEEEKSLTLGETETQIEEKKQSPFTIVNETGLPLTYLTSEVNAVPHRLSHYDSAPINFSDRAKASAAQWEGHLDSVSKTLTVRLEDPAHLFEKPDRGLPIDRIGKYKLRLTSRREEGKIGRAHV